MGMISDADKSSISEALAAMEKEVKLVVFSKENCNFCSETLEICNELSEMGKKLSIQSYTIEANREESKRYGVDTAPAIIIEGKTSGVRFYGLPGGFEFTSLIEGIIDVSNGTTSLSPETKKSLASLKKNAHIMVFVTQTCPYCPRMVRLAHMFAVESPMITADVVQAAEFPDLAMKYKIMAVPAVAINGSKSIEGVKPEEVFLKKIMEA